MLNRLSLAPRSRHAAPPFHNLRFILWLSLVVSLQSLPTWAQRVTFENFAEDSASGIEYTRTRSLAYAQIEALQQQSLVEPVPFTSTLFLPHRPGGFPGIAILDHDGDGDLDIYVTNGPGTANSLFVNQLTESGTFTFVDAGAASGAGATGQDSNGVCYGDFDNDGDEDLVVLGRQENNRLFENLGGGGFRHVAASGLEGGELSHIGCTVGDVDADGLLDVFVGNVFDLGDQLGISGVDPFAFNHPNRLYRNLGGLRFADVSETSGILDLVGLDTSDPRAGTITWAVAMADIDRDGDMDILQADDQASLPGPVRGLIHVLVNDGTGHFTDLPVDQNPFSVGNWMSLSIGDLDCDSHLDIFSSNFGDYGLAWLGGLAGLPPYTLGQEMSRWMLGRGDGTFTDPLGDGEASVFGWGSGIADLDNDGDPDLLYHGGIDGFLTTFEDNPGVVLENQGCRASFVQNTEAFRGDYRLRGTHGVALGDLNRDGRVDVVTTSEHRLPEGAPLVPSPAVHGNPDFDHVPAFWLQYVPNAEGLFSWGGLSMEPGGMTVELNTTAGAGGFVIVEALGTVGLVDRAEVNRSGIGAILSFTPRDGVTVTAPVVGGSSYLSQNALERHFGLGEAPWGLVEVQWSSGVRNRLYQVEDGERVVLPEIPCSIDTDDPLGLYVRCVLKSMIQLRRSGEISAQQGARLLSSAIRGYQDIR